MASTKAMTCFMEPRSVAIIGLTRKTGPGSYNLLESMRNYGYAGKVFPVNPQAEEILGVRSYKDVKEIKEQVDLAVISTPRHHVPPILEDCASLGIRAAIVIPQGFADADAEGKALQERMSRIARERGIRVLGPNTLGVVNAFSGFGSTFMPVKREKVPVGVICQSGIFFFGASLFSWKMGKGIDIGNGCDIDFADALEYFGQDRDIKVILLHVEGTQNGARLFEVARKVARKKPIIVLKTARSDRGARAAATHSGAMIGDHVVFKAALEQCGAMVVSDGDEALDLTKTFLTLPPMKGKDLAVVTFTGAGAIMFIDALESQGLKVAQLSERTIRCVQDLSPKWMPIGNPLDIWPAVMKHGMEKVYTTALQACLEDRGVDGVLCIGVAPNVPEMAFADATSLINRLAGRFPGKPIVAWLYGPNQHERYKALEGEGRVVAFPTVERAGRAFKALYDYQLMRKEKAGAVSQYRVKKAAARHLIKAAVQRKMKNMDQGVWPLLEAYGIPAVPWRFACNQKEAMDAASQLGYPVALKVHSCQIVHKSDVGGVRLNIKSRRDLRKVYSDMLGQVKERLPGIIIEGVIVQKMAEGGLEVILGGKRDPQFGPVVMFGLGGIHTEIFGDTACKVAPLTRADARKMLDQIKAAPLIHGVRGHAESDRGFLIESILRLSQLMVDLPHIQELDLNPVKVFQQGGVVVDARILLSETP